MHRSPKERVRDHDLSMSIPSMGKFLENPKRSVNLMKDTLSDCKDWLRLATIRYFLVEIDPEITMCVPVSVFRMNESLLVTLVQCPLTLSVSKRNERGTGVKYGQSLTWTRMSGNPHNITPDYHIILIILVTLRFFFPLNFIK